MFRKIILMVFLFFTALMLLAPDYSSNRWSPDAKILLRGDYGEGLLYITPGGDTSKLDSNLVIPGSVSAGSGISIDSLAYRSNYLIISQGDYKDSIEITAGGGSSNIELSLDFPTMLIGAGEELVLWRYIGQTNDSLKIYKGGITDTLYTAQDDSILIEMVRLDGGSTDTTTLIDTIYASGDPLGAYDIDGDTVVLKVRNLYNSTPKVVSGHIGGKID